MNRLTVNMARGTTVQNVAKHRAAKFISKRSKNTAEKNLEKKASVSHAEEEKDELIRCVDNTLHRSQTFSAIMLKKRTSKDALTRPFRTYLDDKRRFYNGTAHPIEEFKEALGNPSP